MRKGMVLWGSFLLFWLWAAGARADDFSVLSFSPQGETSGRPEIGLTFSAPVAEAGLVGKIVPSPSLPLEIRPPLEGDAVWDGPDRLVFTPRAALAPATEYRVTLKALRDRSGRLLAGPQAFEFRTAPLKLLSVRPTERTPYGEMTLEFSFSLPVPPQRLAGFVTAESDGRRIDLTPQGQVPSERVVVRTDSLSGPSLRLTVERGLTSDAGPLGLETTETITLDASPRLFVTGSYAESGDGGGRLILYTSRPVDPADVRGYLTLAPERPFRVEPLYGGFALVGDFASRERITVALKKGLGGGEGLAADETLSFVLPDRDRSLRFPVAGTFLSTAEAPRIPLETVNVDAVDVAAWKLYPNNVPLVTGALGEGTEPPKALSRSLGTTAFRVDSRLNGTVRSALDLGALLGEDRGVFLVEARDGADGWEVARQVVTLTDLGLSARVWERGLLVWVNGLSSAEAVKGAAVSVYSSSNQLLAQGVTDSDGLWIVERETPWDPQLRPAVVTVAHEGDLSFLTLAGDRFADGADRSGSPWVTTYEAACLLPRGIFRPGEGVTITSCVRGPRMALPGTFPVLWKVTNALGMEAFRGVEPLSAQGTATAVFELPAESPTGRYRFDLFVPGAEETPLGSAVFQVEDFTPPRIEADLTSSQSRTRGGEALTLSFGAAYLFGAPAPELAWELQARTLPRTYRSTRFPQFTFGDDEKDFQGSEVSIASGVLDASGRASCDWTVPGEWTAPSMVELVLSLQVMEPGGRWVFRPLSLPCAVTPLQIGIRSPEGDLLPDRPLPFEVAAVTADDLPAEVSLTWELFSLADRYVMVREEGRTRMGWQEERIPLSQGTVALGKGRAPLSLRPGGEGRFLLVLSDGEGSSASTRFDVWRPWGSASRGASLPDRVDLELDRDRYGAGDRASLAYRAPFPGRALFTVEAEGLVEARVLRAGASGTVAFAVDGGIWPNGWCTFQMIRPAGGDGPVSALGALPLPVETGSSRASVTLELPDKAEPGGKLDAVARVTDDRGRPLSGELWLALVDRAVLGLTGHETPDPQALFTARRRLGSRARDLYDELIPVESRQTPLLHPAGGAGGALGALLSPLQARGFRLLSEVRSLPVEGGEVRTSFDLPQFSGGARLMAVFSGASVGSAQDDVAVARPLTVDPSLPQVLAPGDRPVVPLQILSTASDDLALEVAVEARGSLRLDGESAFSLTVAPGESRLLDLPLEASAESGYGTLSVAVRGPGLDFVVERETVVRPPMPPVTLSGSAVIEGGSFVMKEEGRWLPGTLRTSLYLSGSPKADLLPLLSLLRDYPYGCLEQRVSSAWPLVVLPDRADGTRSIGEVVASLQTYQLYNGGFASWPNGSFDGWGSLYAAHFLASLEAGQVPEAMARRVRSFLGSVLSDVSDDGESLSRKAYAAYVMALSGEPPLGWMAWLAERAGEMDDAGRALLAGSYGLAGKKEEGLALAGGTGLPGRDPYASPLRDRALRLLALGALDRGGAAEASLAAELLRSVASGPLSSQEAATALMALGPYLARADLRPFSAVVDDGTRPIPLATGDDLLLSADRFVAWKVENAGPGPLYAAWTASGVPLDAVAAEDRGLRVRRTFTDREGAEIDMSQPLTLGQELHVRIDIVPTGAVRDVVVIDLLPGCFDVWNPALGPEEETVGARRDVRFDRVLLFPDALDGSVTLGYRCRVVARGDFALPPVVAEAMYAPGVRSLGGGGRLTVR
ncbi:Ig-like domain-containing alpha-2-macroglobulin family protein [Aminirod propionatiphilus]|uniref:Ig-like domain-containing protein n=1 Tax=Aminirod propionatiphilus TaxID=3415223 RepID=A0ACD1DVT6_9BACT|nr:Ig-like domain-containing protein [Synergistota bacterium]